VWITLIIIYYCVNLKGLSTAAPKLGNFTFEFIKPLLSLLIFKPNFIWSKIYSFKMLLSLSSVLKLSLYYPLSSFYLFYSSIFSKISQLIANCEVISSNFAAES